MGGRRGQPDRPCSPARRLSLCAQCRAQRLRGRIVAAEQGVRLRDIRLQGYGVQLLFDDGHERGIYPWSYLRDEL